MIRIAIVAATLAIVSPAFAQQNDLEKAAAICNSHRHLDSSAGGPISGRPIIPDAGWEHCTELMALKLKHDEAAEAAKQTDLAVTKRALESLKK